ncbi:MAG: hypothetical protein ACYC0V_19020 [Armatimonadota bacterium]
MRYLAAILAGVSFLIVYNISFAKEAQTETRRMRIPFYTGNLSVGYFMEHW